MGKFYELYDSDAEIGINKLSVRTAGPSAGDEQQATAASSMSWQQLTEDTLCIWLMARTRRSRSKMTAMTGRRARCGFPEGALESYSQRFLKLGHQVSQSALSGIGKLVSAAALLGLST